MSGVLEDSEDEQALDGEAGDLEEREEEQAYDRERVLAEQPEDIEDSTIEA